MSITIRPVMLNDIEGIQRVAELSWKDTYRSIFPMDFINDYLNQAYSKESLESVIQKDQKKNIRRFILAESGEEVVGYAQFSDNNDGEVELFRIYVNPSYQGKGIGKSLIANHIEMDHLIRTIFAWVEEENQRGIGFYKANGFSAKEDKVEEINGQKLRLHRYIKTVL